VKPQNSESNKLLVFWRTRWKDVYV
jgi:hypothetical protein